MRAARPKNSSMMIWRGMAMSIAWRTARSVRNGCGVFVSDRWPSTSVFGSLKLIWIRSMLMPGSETSSARGITARQILEDCRFHLQVPGEVVVARLQHGPGRRSGIAAALDVDGGEERLVRLPGSSRWPRGTRSFGRNSVITNGPVPIGNNRKSGLLAATGSSLKACAGRMRPLVPPTNGSNQVAEGSRT